MTRHTRVYVSGPMAGAPGSNYLENLRLGIDCGRILMKMGCIPFVPHNGALTGLVYPEIPHAEWIAYDLAWVEACDALIRIPGASSGADQEVAHARSKSIPVFEIGKKVVCMTHLAVADAIDLRGMWGDWSFGQWLQARKGTVQS